ncbi:TetR/AcrR family transcriptional regulator [Deinococcus alpinitundrae]|uniref:TetR/AcrR family transcriptional regulator n=1 Tax=Deinococcus alpinitundrae TaxID=468913 RepID=UPI00137AD11D|nr:TetR/AcrR family transcriptional regulator [Deinococcus alpinitundrae]
MPRPPADQPLLTPDRIIATALGMIDQDGIDALSTRRLATELGVSSKAVYHYYATKDDLLHAVYLAILDELEQPADPSAPWEEQLRHSAKSLRRLAFRHPSFLTGFLQYLEHAPRELEALDAFYTLLRQAGVPDPLVWQTGQFLLTFLTGFLRAEREGAFTREEYEVEVGAVRRYPKRYHTTPYLPAPQEGSDAHFDLALDLIIRGLQASATGSPPDVPLQNEPG